MGLLDVFARAANTTRDYEDEDIKGDGIISPLTPELTLDMSDDELIKLKKEWIKEWDSYKKEIEKVQRENEEYWLGQHFASKKEDRPLQDNLIFEAVETFLPIATRPKAEPVVEGDSSPAGQELASKTRKMLIFILDQLSFNLKMKQVARYWALYLLGVMKVGWSMKENDLTCVAVRPQKLILDPKGSVEECEYTGYYIGETMDDIAGDLISRFPDKEDFIEEKVKDKKGTKLEYQMWTTDDYTFWTLDDEVLGKIKNPHWNYGKVVPAMMDEFASVPMDSEGQPMTQEVPGRNHFKNKKKPYVFLSIFNLGKQPHDDTNLVCQNIPLQDLINKRLAQIDKNADNANGGTAVSGDSFTEEQAAKVAKAKRSGGTIWVPTGKIDDAIQNLDGKPMPDFVYQSLLDYRDELRNIFGIRGSTPQGTVNEETVRGKVIVKGQDADRIGGGISTYLEEFSDHVLNWFLQLMYVYYDEPHYASVIGTERAQEFISLSNSEFGKTKLMVSVKEGSMVPTDPLSKRNEAVELWSAGALDPITLFDRLEFPNPRDAAKQLYLWKADPVQLFPDLFEQQQQMMAQQQQQQVQTEERSGQQQRQLQADKALQQGSQQRQKAQVEAQKQTQQQQGQLQQLQLQARLKT